MWPQVLALAVAAIPAVSAANITEQLRIADCKIDATSIDDCDPVGYGIRALSFLLPAILLAFIMLFSCPFYCSFKYCCNCCGGRSQNPNCCCGCTDKKVFYNRFNLYRAKFYPLVILGVGIAMFVIGYTGSAKVMSNAGKFVDEVRAIPNILDTTINDVNASLVVEVYNATTDTIEKQALLDTLEAGRDARKQANDIKKDIDEQFEKYISDYRGYIDGYPWVPYIVFGLPLLLFIVGAVCGLVNLRSFLPVSLAWVAFFVGFLMWFLHGSFSISAFVFSDICAEVTGITKTERNVVASLAQCNNDMFADFNTNIVKVERDQAKEACTQLTDKEYNEANDELTNVNDAKIFSVPPVDCNNVLFADIAELSRTVYTHPKILVKVAQAEDALALALADTSPARDTIVATARNAYAPFNGSVCSNRTGNCTIERCASECHPNETTTLSTVGKAAKVVLFLARTVSVVSTTIDGVASRFSDCDSVMSIVISPLDPSCSGLVDGLILVRIASGSFGILCIMFIFAMAFGTKRFAAYQSIDDYHAEEDLKKPPTYQQNSTYPQQSPYPQ